VIGDRVLREIAGPEREKRRGEWKRVHNVELKGVYTSPKVVWLSMMGHVAHVEERRNAITCFRIGITHQM
jgi:hypothetical protein